MDDPIEEWKDAIARDDRREAMRARKGSSELPQSKQKAGAQDGLGCRLSQ